MLLSLTYHGLLQFLSAPWKRFTISQLIVSVFNSQPSLQSRLWCQQHCFLFQQISSKVLLCTICPTQSNRQCASSRNIHQCMKNNCLLIVYHQFLFHFERDTCWCAFSNRFKCFPKTKQASWNVYFPNNRLFSIGFVESVSTKRWG